MNYVMMSIEEASKFFKSKGKDVVVLVSVQDLEDENSCISFEKKKIHECQSIIDNAETVVRAYDDFVNQLRAFTTKQMDFRNISPYGKMSTILFRE